MTQFAGVDLNLVKQRIEDDMRQRARRGLVSAIAQCLGGHEMQLLASLGVDGNEKLLQIFVEEATNLLKKGEPNANR